jgi:hypothetical protein
MAVGLALLLYGRGLFLPFHMDDVPQIPWVDQQSWTDLWTKPHFFNTYRPLVYSTWKLFITIQGNYHAFPLKLFNLTLHIVNGLLVGHLALRWWGRDRKAVAFAATAFFIVFPWSYQTISWPASLFHPLITAFALITVLAYDRLRRGGSRLWMALVTALLLVAPFTHELGYVFIPLLLLLEIRGRGEGAYRGIPYWLAGPAVGVVITYLLRQAVPGALTVQSDFALSSPENFFQNSSYLLQVITYPTAQLSGALTHRAGVNDMLSVWLVGLPTLVALLWLVRRSPWYAWLPALAWAPLAAAILVLFVNFGTLIDAPRQFAFASVGVALLWSGAFVYLFPPSSGPARRRVAYLLLALLVIPSTLPIVANMDHLVMLTETLDDIAAAGREAETEGAPLLFVNLPEWTAHMPPPYALGHFGTQLFVVGNSHQVIYVTNQRKVPTRDVIFTNLLPSLLPYSFAVHKDDDQPDNLEWDELAAAIRDAQQVYLTQYTASRVYTLPVGQVTPTADADSEQEPIAVFASGMRLMEAETVYVKGRPGVRFVWNLPAVPEPNQDIFVHLYDASGQLISQADGPFLMGLYPMWIAAQGEHIIDYRYFASQPAGASYTVGVGLYDPTTGERVSVTDGEGNRLEDDVVRLNM